MRLLVVNDDGYRAPGIKALVSRLKGEHSVVVVAPKDEKSGSSHFVNFFGGITYEKISIVDGVETYAVGGSPADCVIFAVKYLFKGEHFDAVLSGINSVLNIGSDIIYSGTVGAAQEGTYHGIPSVAISLRTKGTQDYTFAADFVAENLEYLVSLANSRTTVSVNIPSVKREDILGVKVAPITYRPYDETYVKVEGENGEEMYVVDGHPDRDATLDPNGDVVLCYAGYITVTPLLLITTDEKALANMDESGFKL